MATADGRAAVAAAELSAAGRQAVQTGLRQIDRLTGELDPLRRQLDMFSRRQPGAKCAARPAAPNHAFHIATRDPAQRGLATVSVARKLDITWTASKE
jgi:hypothetical protein